MMPYLLAALSSVGTYLLVSAVLFKRRSLIAPQFIEHFRKTHEDLLGRAGITANQRGSFLRLVATLFVFGALLGGLAFGGILSAVAFGCATAVAPLVWYRQRHQQQREEAAEAWPHLIEEVRVLCTSAGKPIPQAFLTVGLRGPEVYREGFRAAMREWTLTTDFARATQTLTRHLADPVADVVAYTLLVAHQSGGTDTDRRLRNLARDRTADVAARRDARARLSGVRFARRFVLIVPLGMALAGMSIGNGRAAYATSTGQLGIATALVLLGMCWVWSGRLIRLPQEQRVLYGS